MDISDSFNSRPSPIQKNAYYNSSHNLLHEGVVHSVTLLDRLEGKVVVYLPLSRTYVRASVEASFCSVNNIGTFNPLVPGDKVRVMHLGGNSGQATIVGYSSWKSKLPNHFNQESKPLALPSNLHAGGLPGATIPEWLKYGGAAQCTVYPLITESKGSFSTKPGAYDLFLPDGNRSEFTPGTKSTYNKSEIRTVLSDTYSLKEGLLARNAEVTQCLDEIERWCTLGTLSYSADYIKWLGIAPAVCTQEDRQKLNIEYLEILHEFRDEQFDAMEEKLAAYDKTLDCLEDAAKEVQKKSRSSFDKIISQLITTGTSLALTTLNKQLPADWQVNLNVIVNDNNQAVVKSISVGDLTYNSETSTVTMDGRLFNLATNKALSQVNKLLPSFLKVSSSDLGIVIGVVTIPTANLKLDEDQEFPIKDEVVFLNKKGTAYLTISGNKFSLGNLKDLLEDRLSTKAVTELNEILPDELQVSYSKDSDGNRTIDIGPLSVVTEGSKVGVSLDRVKLTTLLEQSPESLFSQMGAPAGYLARILWKPLSSKIITTLLGKSAEQKKEDQAALIEKLKKSISKKVDPCGIGVESSIPLTISQVPTHNTSI